jgi:hypothetical protein
MRASSSLQEAGSRQQPRSHSIPTSVWTCHRHREFPSPLAPAGMATTAPPSSGASALAWSRCAPRSSPAAVSAASKVGVVVVVVVVGVVGVVGVVEV